jgi:carbonic anhydrase
MTLLPEILAANRRYAAGFDKGRLPRPPSKGIAVVTCIDGRINAHAILGLQPGEANVIRNAGGRAADAVRSLAVSQHILGTREIVLMFHTDCGQAAFGTDAFRQRVTEELASISCRSRISKRPCARIRACCEPTRCFATTSP